MRATKFIALIAAVFGLAGAFVPIAHAGASVSAASLIGNGGLLSLLAILAFVPFLGIGIHAVVGIRKRYFRGVYTLVLAVLAAVGFAMLFAGIGFLDLAGHAWAIRHHTSELHVAAPGFVVGGIGLALAFAAGALEENWPEERPDIT